MTFGEAGKEGARVHDIKDVEKILDVFQAHGHNEVWQSLVSSSLGGISLILQFTRWTLPGFIVVGPVKSTLER